MELLRRVKSLMALRGVGELHLRWSIERVVNLWALAPVVFNEMSWETLIALIVAATSPVPATTSTTTCRGAVDPLTFEAGVPPPACWRPYRPESPFNTEILPDPPSVEGSEEIADKLTESGAIGSIAAGDPERDFGIATYHAQPGDPLRTVTCIEPWGTCDLEGVEVPIPEDAVPSGVWPLEEPDDDWDSHLTVIDHASGVEYDLWNIRELDEDSVTIKWGGITSVRGYGLGSDAVASQNGSIAGMVRAEELRAGRIDHALALFVPCVEGYVYPATKDGLDCTDAGFDGEDRPAMGAHFQLPADPDELAAAPPWKRAILKALDRYGAYVVDTSGTEGVWGVKHESPAGYTSLGEEDPFVELANDLGFGSADINGNGLLEYFFNFQEGVDFSRLRVVPASVDLGG